MKISAKLAAATAVALLMTLPASALDLGVDIGADVGVDLDVVGVDLSVDANAAATAGASKDEEGSTTQVDASTKAKLALGASAADDGAANGTIEIGEVISLIANSDWSETSLDGVVPDGAELIDADEIVADAAAEFDATLDAKAGEIDELHAALAANAALSAWLDAEDVSADSVVALGVKADGKLAVITSNDEPDGETETD